MSQSTEGPSRPWYRMFSLRQMNMRAKLLVLVALVACTSIAVMTFFSYRGIRDTTIQKEGTMLVNKGEEVLHSAEKAVENRVSQLRALALSPSIVEAVRAANQQPTPDAAALEEAWVNGNEQGDQLAQEIEGNAVSEQLRTFQQRFPEQVEVFVTDQAGLNVAMTGRTGDYRQSDEQWWKAAYDGGAGAIYVGKVEYDESAGNYALNIGVPVQDEQGKTLGVMRGTVDVSMLFEDVASVTVGETGHAVLINAEGKVLAARDQEQLMQPAPDEMQSLLEAGRNDWREQMTDLEGQQAVVGASFMEGELGKKMGWMLLLDRDLQELEAGLKQALLRSLLVGAGLLVVLLLIGLWVARSITHPIQKLDTAAQEVAAGDLDATVDVDTRDEIGSLSSSFNQMIANVREAMEEVTAKKTQAETATREAHEARSAAEEQQAFLSRSVEQMMEAMNRFAGGDLTVRLEMEQQTEEMEAARSIQTLYEGFNEVVAKLRATMSRVHGAVEDTSAAASDISVTTDQLATGAEEQSTQAHEVAAAMEEMTNTINSNTRSTQQTADAASQNDKIARQGGEVVQQTIEKIDEIAEAVDTSATRVDRLGNLSAEIGQIVATIDEIADQTNLLALNAAIEAARAGEEGKGFAVVADEVRELAVRTTAATEEIEGIIQTVQEETQGAVQDMQVGTARVEEGIELADRTGEVLDDVVASTDRISAMITEIASATEQQSVTSEEIAHSVQNISTVSQESAAGITQISASTSDLDRLADDLREVVAHFRIGQAVQQERPAALGAADGGDGHSKPSPGLALSEEKRKA